MDIIPDISVRLPRFALTWLFAMVVTFFAPKGKRRNVGRGQQGRLPAFLGGLGRP